MLAIAVAVPESQPVAPAPSPTAPAPPAAAAEATTGAATGSDLDWAVNAINKFSASAPCSAAGVAPCNSAI